MITDNYGVHFITFSCYNRWHLFVDDHIYATFIKCLDSVRTKYGFKLWAFVVMPNHVHFVIKVEQGNSQILKSIAYTLRHNSSFHALRHIRKSHPQLAMKLLIEKKDRTVGKFWETGAGWSRELLYPATARQTIDYIHNNPVRKGLVQDPTAWKYSSAKFWILGVPEPLQMDVPEFY